VRRYSKLLGLRAWSIVRRPVWAIVVVVGAIYEFLQVVARVQAERLVRLFDALHQWDPFYEWWYIPLPIIVFLVLLKAGYELWKEEEQARQTVEARFKQFQQESYAMQLENQRLRAMSPEEFKILQNERRKRLKRWRDEIRTHSFVRHPLGASLFANTETYSDMKPLLPRNVRQRYESGPPVEAILSSPRKIGREGDKRVLLDEVSRIEKQWGLV
jgi:hypothetical protein